jgi:hypothetical protein
MKTCAVDDTYLSTRNAILRRQIPHVYIPSIIMYREYNSRRQTQPNNLCIVSFHTTKSTPRLSQKEQGDLNKTYRGHNNKHIIQPYPRLRNH